MKKFAISLLLCFTMAGCVSSVVKEKLSLNAAKLDGYVSKMDDGLTTRDQDQNLIRAMRIWTWSMNQASNGETPPEDIMIILNQMGRD